jgi:hypothetical protein
METNSQLIAEYGHMDSWKHRCLGTLRWMDIAGPAAGEVLIQTAATTYASWCKFTSQQWIKHDNGRNVDFGQLCQSHAATKRPRWYHVNPQPGTARMEHICVVQWPGNETSNFSVCTATRRRRSTKRSVIIYWQCSTNHTYWHGKLCLRQYDLLNYQTDLFKTYIFRQTVIRHWW